MFPSAQHDKGYGCTASRALVWSCVETPGSTEDEEEEQEQEEQENEEEEEEEEEEVGMLSRQQHQEHLEMVQQGFGDGGREEGAECCQGSHDGLQCPRVS